MHRELPAQPVEPILSGGSKYNSLRIADPQHHCRHPFTVEVDLGLSKLGRRSHVRAKCRA